ncbi:hypothetical protein VNO77_27715 [Canavalia gladiata]|uniref:Uncharacterized protein n=1 Tax=Canavalia gladiata TaxID=3824 RepID=A0AAN9KYC5_CANGL
MVSDTPTNCPSWRLVPERSSTRGNNIGAGIIVHRSTESRFLRCQVERPNLYLESGRSHGAQVMNAPSTPLVGSRSQRLERFISRSSAVPLSRVFPPWFSHSLSPVATVAFSQSKSPAPASGKLD